MLKISFLVSSLKLFTTILLVFLQRGSRVKVKTFLYLLERHGEYFMNEKNIFNKCKF